MTKAEIIEKLSLTPLDIEGGYFSEVYRAKLAFPKEALPKTFKADSYTASTSIYYLLGKEDKSKMHAVSADETWHFYKASSVDVFIELLVLFPDKTSLIVNIGSNIEDGEVPQYTIEAGAMMGARICSKSKELNPDSWVLAGATVAPSFEYADFTLGNGNTLSQTHPQHKEMILSLS